MTEEGWFYMSFCDPELPTGQQFVGAVYVQANRIEDAIERSWAKGINPGGEVAFVGPYPTVVLDEEGVPAEYREVLLTKEQVEGH